jgi:hypothetical protein
MLDNLTGMERRKTTMKLSVAVFGKNASDDIVFAFYN